MNSAGRFLLILGSFYSFDLMAEPAAPQAKRIPHQIVAPHGHSRDDPYYWLRERDNPAVLTYLQEENAYTCLLYTSPSPPDLSTSRMPSSA